MGILGLREECQEEEMDEMGLEGSNQDSAHWRETEMQENVMWWMCASMHVCTLHVPMCSLCVCVHARMVAGWG